MNINPGILDGLRRIGLRVRDLVIEGGLPGVPLGFRLRGALKVGPPLAGTWRAGDVALDRNGVAWICTKAGTPGLWAMYQAILWPSGDQSGATDTLVLQAALNSGGAYGTRVVAAVGDWYLNAPLQFPAGVRLSGVHADVNDIAHYGTNFNIVSTWAQGGAAQAAALLFNGLDCAVDHINLDAHYPAFNLHAIFMAGNCGLVEDVNICHGFNYGVTPTGLSGRVERVTATQCYTYGFWGINTDADYTDCIANANMSHGWYLQNPINSRLIACRSEWNGGYGYYVTGDNGATGGMSMIGCSTDRNTSFGIYVDSTGNWPLLLSGTQLRRDGSNGTDAAIGVASTATSPVIADGLAIFPGFNDDGSGTQSPVTGISVASGATLVSVSGALIHAVTTPVSGKIVVGKGGVVTRTGSWNSPSAPVVIPGSMTGVTLGTTFNSGTGTAAQNVTGMAVTLQPGSYVLKGRFWYTAAGTTGSTQTFAFTFGGTASSAIATWQFKTAAYTAPVTGTSLTTSSGLSPTLTTVTYPLDWEAHVTVTAAGTLQLTVQSTTSGDEVSVIAGSYISVEQTAA